MTKTRNMFHHQGMTDLSAMRRDAEAHAAKGESVVLHLHPYEEEYDGCADDYLNTTPVPGGSGHELYGAEVMA